MARSGANSGKNSKSARSSRKYKRNGSGQFGSGPGTVHKGRGGKSGAARAHQSNGGASAQKVGSAKNSGHRSTGRGDTVGGKSGVEKVGFYDPRSGRMLSHERGKEELSNTRRKTVAGAVLGSVVPGFGTYIGALAGNEIAHRQNVKGRAPKTRKRLNPKR